MKIISIINQIIKEELSKDLNPNFPRNGTPDEVYDFYDSRYPRAGDQVDGLVLRDDVPNTESISASAIDYEKLGGVREVPFSDFETIHDNRTSVREKVAYLIEAIQRSGEINPLIVIVEEGVPYTLEGYHRFQALQKMGKKYFPAVVVISYD